MYIFVFENAPIKKFENILDLTKKKKAKNTKSSESLFYQISLNELFISKKKHKTSQNFLK